MRPGFAGLLGAMGLVLFGVLGVGAEPPDERLLSDIQPAEREQVAGRIEGLPEYTITAQIDELTGTITGTMSVRFTNRSADALTDLWFRLFPNIAYYGEGDLAVTAVAVDGAAATSELGLEETALRVMLAEPLEMGSSTTVDLAFVTTVPVDSLGSYGIFSRDSAAGIWVLADWYPILAVYEPDSGWNLPPPSSAGDPTFAESSMYDVRLTVPESLVPVATGVEVSQDTAVGMSTYDIVGGPARDFTLVLTRDYATVVREAGGVRIVVAAPNGSPTAAELDQAAEIAVQALQVFEERFGPYPFTELDIVETRLNRALAVSWAGVIFVDGGALARWGSGQDRASLETLIAHEIAHLWWGAMLNADSNLHPFINEGLSTLSAALYQFDVNDPETAALQVERWIGSPVDRLVWAGDQIVDLPAAEGDALNSRYEAIYGKSTVGFLAIREALGPDVFDAVLRGVVADEMFSVYTPDDLRQAFAEAPGADPALINSLWSRWFEETLLTAEEADQAIQALIAEPRP